MVSVCLCARVFVRLCRCLCSTRTILKLESSSVMEAAGAPGSALSHGAAQPPLVKKGRRGKKSTDEDEASKKRRCISSACVPCRKRKSKVCYIYVTDRRA